MPPFHPDRGRSASPISRAGPPGSADGRELHGTSGAPWSSETGSAVVEFVFLGVLLLVPVVYLVLTMGQLQGASFAVVGAADQAAKVYVDAPTLREADARAREAVRIALADFGLDEELASVDIGCSEQCLAPGSTVTVVVRLEVPLPLRPAIVGAHPSIATVDATSTQLVERFG